LPDEAGEEEPDRDHALRFAFGMTWEILWALILGFALSTIWGALIGPLVAIISFVCSIGNVPLAAVLWNGGIAMLRTMNKPMGEPHNDAHAHGAVLCV